MLKLLGIPFDGNSSYKTGPAKAPEYIKKMDLSGSANRYSESGLEIIANVNYQDLGNIDLAACSSEEAYHKIKSEVSKVINSSGKLISIGGDHSIAYPTIETHVEKYGKLNVLQFDAHGDLYESYDNNPYSHASPFARLLEKGLLASLTQVGIRSLNNHQRDQIKKYGVKVIEMREFSTDFLKDLKSPLYISLDLDVLDPAYAPGVSHHEPGGLSTRALIDMIAGIEVDVIGAEIVEYNPDRDINEMTAMVQYKLFKELAAKMI